MSVSRLNWADAKVVHWTSVDSANQSGPEDELTSTEPASVSIEFIAHGDAYIQQQGRTRTLKIAPGAITLCGPDRIDWVGTSGSGPGEFIEITASARLRREVAEELQTPASADLDDIHGWRDPVVWAIASRLRSAALRTIHLSDVERDFLLRRLYGHVLDVQFGGRGPARGYGRLDQVRARRVLEFIDANLDGCLTVDSLAQVAALSPFHFVRAFRQSLGLTPHRYVRARRLERARQLLVSGQRARDVAQWIGYESVSHFRTAYYTEFGHHVPAVQKGSR
jgi:AraC family transcriptional regulator